MREDSHEVRGKHLVYKLVDAGEIVYVGQSIKLDLRETAHKKDKVFDEVLYTEVESTEEKDSLENYLILMYTPKYNDTIKLSKARNYVNKFYSNFDKIVWYNWVGKNPEYSMEMIDTLILLRYISLEGTPASLPIEINLNWNFEKDSAIRTFNDEDNGEPHLILNKGYAGNLFRRSLSNIRTWSNDELEDFVFQNFVDHHCKKDKAEAMLCINRIREISRIYQEFTKRF